MTTYYLHATYRGFELHKSNGTTVEEIFDEGEIEEFGDDQWRPMEAFLDDDQGVMQSAQVFETTITHAPPKEWLEKEGHRVLILETSLTFEFEADETPQPEDFEWVDGPTAFYKGNQLEMVDGDDIYYMVAE